MSIKIAVIFLTCLVVAARGYTIDQCKNGAPLPKSIKPVDCDDSMDRCPLYRGENGKAYITFDVPSDQETMSVKVLAHVGGLPAVPFPMPEPNACNSLSEGYCPVEEGESVTYFLNVPVKRLYPKISLDLEISILDENGEEPLTCFVFPCKVVDRNA